MSRFWVARAPGYGDRMDEPPAEGTPEKAVPARTQLAVAVGIGVIAGVAATLGPGGNELGPLIGWDVAALVYLIWVWGSIWRADAAKTARLALSEDPTRGLTDVVLLIAAVASLASVGWVLARAAAASGNDIPRVTLAVVSVILSWSITHTIFTLKYARLYYVDDPGGLNFNQSEPPNYGDFAYFSFTVGMTFQVSDTVVEAGQIRRSVLQHALLSYVFGTGLLATAINLVATVTAK